MKPSAIAKSLPLLLQAHQPVFMWGPPGGGKSDVVHQVAAGLEWEIRDVRLSLLDPVDLRGFPVPDLAKRMVKWLPPEFLPTDKKSKGVLFLDEMNHAPPAMQSAAYQLVLNRRIGEYVLPDGWAVMAAGNRSSDRSHSLNMSAALSNRFVHLDFEVNMEDWMFWAQANGIHSDIRAFIAFRPAHLHNFEADKSARAFASPRSWTFVNKIYQQHAGGDDEFELIRGTVGEGVASEFLAFVKVIRDLPTVESILKAPGKIDVPKEQSSKLAIILALENATTAKNINDVMIFVRRIPDVEIQTMFIRYALKRNSDLQKQKVVTDWLLANQGFIS